MNFQLFSTKKWFILEMITAYRIDRLPGKGKTPPVRAVFLHKKRVFAGYTVPLTVRVTVPGVTA